MRILTKALTILAALYALALTLYLILRLAFGDSLWWLGLLNNFAPFYFLPLIGLLALALLFRVRQMAFILPFAFIGILWFGPYYLPKQIASSGGATLHVLTFNLWARNEDLSRAEEWIRQTNADVVVLQEIRQVDMLPDLLDLYPYQSPIPDGSRSVFNFVLSRFPIADAAPLAAPNLRNQLRVLLDVEGQAVAVYNVHLAFPAPSPNTSGNFYAQVALGYDTQTRNAQIENLLAALESEPYPFIVAGDFNTSDQAVIYGQLAAVMQDSYREVGSGLGTSWPVSRARGLPAFIPPLIRIDYIWHSRHFRALQAEQGPELGSDHLPLLATLELLNTHAD